MRLEPFQRKFIERATADGIDLACLSAPRGNGKSFLGAHLVKRAMIPGDSLFHPGKEVVLTAASLEQARIVYNFVRADLEPLGGYRFLDSFNRIGIRHVESNTRVRVLSSNAKGSFGLVNVPLVVGDEPGAWQVNNGQLLYDSLSTAMGKPGSPLRLILIGTLAPTTTGWWPDMVAGGSHGSTYVMTLQGKRKLWDDIEEIKRVNPLTRISGRFLAKLIEERDAALRDSRLKSRFLSYRMNLPTMDEEVTLITVEEWEMVKARPVPPRVGRPIVSIDIGGGRAWDAACGMWRNGRTECIAVAPGIPSLRKQEQRDNVPAGLYQLLEDGGQLVTVPGKRDPEPHHLHQAVMRRWGRPASVVCDRFRLKALKDAIGPGIPIVPRVARWSEATEDIDSLRRIVRDGPLSCPKSSHSLFEASLAAARVKSDDQGSVRLVKKDSSNRGRDDVAASLVLVAGVFHRSEKNAAPRRLRTALA